MEHARYAYVVNEYDFAGRLGGKVDARQGLPDDCVGFGGLDLNIVGKLQADGLVADQFAVADAAVMPADQAVLDREVFSREFQPLGRSRHEEVSRLGGGLAERHRRDLDRLAGNGGALIGDARRIAEHDDDPRKGNVEFFGDDLPQRSPYAGSEIDMTVERRDQTIGRDLDEGFEFG